MLWARPWNKTVMNPDSGGKPPVGGTSADGRPGGKPRRRRRAKRGGKQIAAPEGSRVHDAQARSEVRRPETQEQLPPRKRKRRRARGNGQSGGSPGGSAGAQVGAAPMPMPMLNRGRTRRRPSRLTRQVMHQMQAGARGEARRRTRRVVCRGARSPRSRMGMERAGRVRKRPSLLPRWQPLARQSRIRRKAAIQRARRTSGMLPINRHARHLAVTSSRTSADARRPMISTRRSILAPITAVC